MNENQTTSRQPEQQAVPDKAQTMPRREFLYLLGGLSASAVACKIPGIFTGWGIGSQSEPESLPPLPPTQPGAEAVVAAPTATAPEVAPAKEIEKPPVIFGWNTHLSPEGSGAGSNLSLAVFKEDIDKMVAMGHMAVRFNVAEWHAVSSLSRGQHFEWIWKEDLLESYRQALEYAKQRQMTVTVVANTPGGAQGLDFAGYTRATELFFGQLARRFEGLVDIWQIFNEPDDHHYKTYASLGQYPKNYLEEFGILVATANMAIKLNDVNAKTTTNVSKWVGADPGIQLEELLFFDAACGFDSTKQIDSACKHLDYITLDLYPDTNQQEIAALPEIVRYFHLRYSKPVIIGELGLPTTAWSEADQGKYVSQAISSLLSGQTIPEQILLYEMRDEVGKGGNEGAFGFYTADGKPKASLDAVVEAMVYEEEK